MPVFCWSVSCKFFCENCKEIQNCDVTQGVTETIVKKKCVKRCVIKQFNCNKKLLQKQQKNGEKKNVGYTKKNSLGIAFEHYMFAAL